MISTSSLAARHGAFLEAASLSVRDYRAVYPPAVLAVSTLPRVLLQVAFLAGVGEVGGGLAGRSFALLGACVHVMAIATVIRGGDVVVDDRYQGTQYRLRLGCVPVLGLALARWWIYAAEGLASGLAAMLLVRPLLEGSITFDPALLIIFLLVAVTLSALGVAVAAVSLFTRGDVFLTNLAAYLLLALGGVVAPLDRLPGPLQAVSHTLPLTNGLLAARAIEAGRAWLGHALLEALVGVAWIGAAALLLAMQGHRSRRLGVDDQP